MEILQTTIILIWLLVILLIFTFMKSTRFILMTDFLLKFGALLPKILEALPLNGISKMYVAYLAHKEKKNKNNESNK